MSEFNKVNWNDPNTRLSRENLDKMSQDIENLIDKSASMNQGEGNESLTLGETAEAISEGSVAFGADSFSGARGYYYSSINFTDKKITLSISQSELVPPTNLTWAVGDKVSITNDEKYVECSTITSISGNVITVDSLPFTSIVELDELGAEDYGILVPEKPEEGEVEFGWYSYSFGEQNKVIGKRSIGAGFRNKVFGDFGSAFGSQNKTGYLGFAGGVKNTVMGRAGVGLGHNNTVSGDYAFAGGGNGNTASEYCASAHGYKTEAKHKYATTFGSNTKTGRNYQFVTGKYNKETDALFAIGNGTSDNRSNAWESFEDGSTKQGGLSTAHNFFALPDYGEYCYQFRNEEEFNANGDVNLKATRGTFAWEDNAAKFTPTSTNNWLQKFVTDGFAEGNPFRYVKIRYRTTSGVLENGTAPRAGLFWRTSSVGGDNVVRSIADNKHTVVTVGGRPRTELITDGEWHDLVYDLSTHSSWDYGTITLLRWQFSGLANGSIYIEQFGLFTTKEEAYNSIPSASLLDLQKGYDKNQKEVILDGDTVIFDCGDSKTNI